MSPQVTLHDLWSAVEASIDRAFATCHASEHERLHRAVEEFNVFLRDEFVGYQLYYSKQHVAYETHRIDNEKLHTEIVQAAFEIFDHPDFREVDQHYAEAWKHYSKGDHRAAINGVGVAMEAAEKTVGRQLDPNFHWNGLSHRKVAGKLFELGVLPSYLQTHRNQLQTLYEQTVNPVRNRTGSHKDLDHPEANSILALLTLNLTGSLLLFLIQSYQERDA